MRGMSTALLMVCLGFVSNAGAGPVAKIAVQGNAEIRVAPDRMYWSVQIETRAPELAKASADHAKIVERALTFLDSQYIAKNKIQSSSSFGEKIEYRNGGPQRDGFIATTHVQFELADLTQYAQLWAGFSQIGGTSINSTEYLSSKHRLLNEKMRHEALLAAKKKAEAMAATLGAVVGKPLLIEELNDQQGPARLKSRLMALTDHEGAANMLSVGEISVSAAVLVEFELLEK